jgi:hypothetical protein
LVSRTVDRDQRAGDYRIGEPPDPVVAFWRSQAEAAREVEGLADVSPARRDTDLESDARRDRVSPLHS